MARAQVVETIQCTPGELVEFAMDPERYRAVDDKIGAIDWVRRDGDVTEFRFRGKLPGLPGPAPKIVSRMRRTSAGRIDVGLPAVPQNRLASRMVAISASWVCEPAGAGTRVTRTLRFDFKPPVRWLAEPVLRRTLQADVEAEMRRAKAYLESA
ncbi:SRPBCC family protein [Qaidamihabitans albus]|uniref:SRPBCC family protein n=1 Tax=Qaidamihabitans albus TaxID=2795733 RepID=UPI0018F171F6|nr:SRPBCC family protein [Qaidamihabitans albus]